MICITVQFFLLVLHAPLIFVTSDYDKYVMELLHACVCICICVYLCVYNWNPSVIDADTAATSVGS